MVALATGNPGILTGCGVSPPAACTMEPGREFLSKRLPAKPISATRTTHNPRRSADFLLIGVPPLGTVEVHFPGRTHSCDWREFQPLGLISASDPALKQRNVGRWPRTTRRHTRGCAAIQVIQYILRILRY